MSQRRAEATRPRRRRPSAQTRALLLDTAARLVLERLASGGDVGNPLAAVRVTDVLAAVNERSAEDEHPMTTGAVYQIWSTQEAFQADLLGHVTYRVATRDLSTLREQIASSTAERLPFREVVLQAGDCYLARQAGSPEMSLAIGLAALVSPQQVRRAEEESNADYLTELAQLLVELVSYGRRELTPGLTPLDLVWAVEALADGVDLRARSHPEVVGHLDEDGRSAVSKAFLGVITALTVPKRRRRPPKESR